MLWLFCGGGAALTVGAGALPGATAHAPVYLLLPYMAGLVIGSTLLGHAVFAYALSGVSANVISFALLGEPVGAMIFSMIFFGEVPTWPVALGGLLTLVGLALSQRPRA